MRKVNVLNKLGFSLAISISLFGCFGGANFKLSSSSFDDGATLPSDFSCEGKNFGDGVHPQLQWEDAPAGTKSFAIVFKDLSLVDVVPSIAYHSVMWDIPAEATWIPEGLSAGLPGGALEGAKQLSAGPGGGESYLGPCPSWVSACPATPPRSSDKYAFVIYALDVKEVDLPAVAEGKNAVAVYDAYFAGVALDSAELITWSDAQPAQLDEGFLELCPAEEEATE